VKGKALFQQKRLTGAFSDKLACIS
jgi:hypothetical protein